MRWMQKVFVEEPVDPSVVEYWQIHSALRKKNSEANKNAGQWEDFQ